MTAETVLSLHIRADIQNVFNITYPRVAAEFISTYRCGWPGYSLRTHECRGQYASLLARY